jgi:hypothetical protein
VLVFIASGRWLVGPAASSSMGGKASKFFWQAKKFPHLAMPELPEKTDLKFKPE